MKIEKLALQHSNIIENFDCGNDEINNYLCKKALADYDTVTQLVLDETNRYCIGYFSLSCGALYMNDSRKLHTYPAVEIKYFAVDKAYQGKEAYFEDESVTYAKLIFHELIYNIIYDFTDTICGASRIILYSTPQAVNFYRRAKFQDFSDLFLVDESSYLEGCIPLIFNYD